MRRIENIFLTVVAVVIGFSALAYNLAGAIAPGVVNAPVVSNLENRFFAGFPEPTAQSIADGDFQRSLDSCIADHIPERDKVMLFNAAMQRASISSSAALFGFDIYPTFFDSHYYAVPRDQLIVDRAEEQPSEAHMKELDAWVNTLNAAAQNHPDIHFVYDCVARHDQTEANPSYQYYSNRINPAWAQENIIDRLDSHITAFVDPVESYDEILNEWFNADPHWTLKRALESYSKIAEQLSLIEYSYEDPITAVSSWDGGYAKSALDLDYPSSLEDLHVDFSQLHFYRLQEEGGDEIKVGARDDVLSGSPVPNDIRESMYYVYYGGGQMDITNEGANNGRTALIITDSLSYCLTRFIASNYERSVFLLPGNDHFNAPFESYIEQYNPDDVIVLTHVSKFESIAEFSPAFIGLDSE